MPDPLLDVRELETKFFMRKGTLTAVDRVSEHSMECADRPFATLSRWYTVLYKLGTDSPEWYPLSGHIPYSGGDEVGRWVRLYGDGEQLIAP